MTIRLLAAGRPADRELLALHERYAQRIRRLGLRYEAEWVRVAATGGRGAADRQCREEARRMLERHAGHGSLVALDIHGQALSSEELAARIERWATPSATLLVGGPAGLHGTALEAATFRWSLSRLTLPHELVPVVVAEQLYRALTIRRGLPYHK